jgi:hypothetical protein
MTLSQIAFDRGACGGLFRMRIPSSANMASKLSVNLVSRSADQELEPLSPLGRIHQDVTGGLGRPLFGRMGGHPGQVRPAGPVLDEYQGIEAFQADRVHLCEVDRENAVGLRDGELLPRRTRTPRCRIDPAAFRISHTVEDAT